MKKWICARTCGLKELRLLKTREEEEEEELNNCDPESERDFFGINTAQRIIQIQQVRV